MSHSRTRSLTWILRGLAAAQALASAAPVAAQVMEPNGLTVPQPVTTNELNIAASRGFLPDALQLEGLFACFNDPLDPVADADIQPSVFSPLCGFTGTLVMRGGGCRLDFGWYNANQSGQRPSEAEIFTLVPADPNIQDFCPLAADHVADPTRADTQMIASVCNSCPAMRGSGVVTFNADSIRTDSRYMAPPAGTGLIGFALRQPAGMGTQCPETHFSENDLNTCTGQGCTDPGPWVMALVYTSKALQDSFYIAFEDLPTANWGSQAQPANDGDFNDFIYLITGLTCEGGGQPCQVPGLVGACASGITACGPGGTIVCGGGVPATAELCDNIDNDCNGMVDDDPTLCTADDKVCYQGRCVPRCGTGEFQCPLNESCDGSLCIDDACLNVTCGAEEVCRGGVCVGACDNVVCPLTANGRQTCQLGRCVDLCAVANCPEGTVCEKGSCVRHCECRACPDGTTCAPEGTPSAGQCVDGRCDGVTCTAPQICFEGTCFDPCDNVTCPGGAICENGACGPPGSGGGGGTSGEGGTGIGAIAGVGGASGRGGSSGGVVAGTAGGGGDDELGGTPPAGDPGCACRSGSGTRSPASALVALGLALAFAVRRRRRAA